MRLAVLAALALTMPAWAQAQTAPAMSPAAAPLNAQARSYSIAPGTLDQVLNRFAAAAGIVFSSDAALTQGKISAGLQGSYSVNDGLLQLLKGHGLVAVRATNGVYSLRPGTLSEVAAEAKPAAVPADRALPTVTVKETAELPGDLPKPYAGGQVARGGRLGMLGNTDLMDAPFNITSYTSELIENQQARSVGAVLANDPSVRDAATSSAPGQYLLIRGFASLESSIYFNGLAGMAPNNRSSTEMVERVELLKGPSAALSGMVPDGSIGGTVLMVPKRAADAPLTRLGLEYGTQSQAGARLDIGRRFGENNAWGIRINGLVRGGEGNVEGRDQRTELGSLALDYRGERLRASLDVYDQNDKRDGTDYYVSFSGQPSAVPDASKPLTLGDTAKARDRMAMARVEFDLTPDVTIFGAYGKHSYRSQWVYANNFGVDSLGNGTVFSGSYRLHADFNAGEVGLRAKVQTGPVSHRITLAATDFKRIGFYGDIFGGGVPTNIFNPTPVTDPGDPGAPPQTESTRLKSIALTDTLGLMNDRMLLTLGLRHQNVKTKSVFSDSYDESTISPIAAGVFKLSDSVSLYANYIQGLSQGPVAPIGLTPPLDNEGEAFPPYRSKQVELGIKGEWDGFGSSLSLFQIAQPNGIVVGNRFTVDGEQRNRGIEWNVFGTLGKRVRVLGGVTLIDAKITKATGATQGKDAFGVPGIQANLGGEWDVLGAQGLTVSGRVLYTDSVFIDSANLFSIPSWTRWDVGARYATRIGGKPLVLRANIENLLDKSHWMGYRQGWRSGTVSRNAPRTLLLSATVDF